MYTTPSSLRDTPPDRGGKSNLEFRSLLGELPKAEGLYNRVIFFLFINYITNEVRTWWCAEGFDSIL